MGLFSKVFGEKTVNRGLAKGVRNEPDLPKSVSESLRWAKEWAKLGNKDEEMRCLRHALTLKEYDQHHPEIYTNMGVVYYEEGKVDLAIEYFDKALAIHSRYLGALFNKGSVLMAQQNWEGALECFDKVLKVSPNDPAASYNKGVVLDHMGKLDEAQKLITRAYRADKFVRKHVDKQMQKKTKFDSGYNVKDV